MPNPYEPIADFLREQPPEVMMNVGIRHGGEWDYFHKEFPDMQLLALEPHEKERLNFIKNHPEESVLPFGVWSSNCKKKLTTGTNLCPSMQLEGKGVEVDCKTLDWLLREFAQDKSRVFLWIDIEGSELEAFKGCQISLESGLIPFIYTELRPKDKIRSKSWCIDKEVIAYLGRFNYAPVLTQQEPNKEHYDVLFKKG